MSNIQEIKDAVNKLSDRLLVQERLLDQTVDGGSRQCLEGISYMLQQTEPNCWLMAIFNLCIRVDTLRRAVHPELKKVIENLLEEKRRTGKTTGCPKLPRSFTKLF